MGPMAHGGHGAMCILSILTASGQVQWRRSKRVGDYDRVIVLMMIDALDSNRAGCAPSPCAPAPCALAQMHRLG